MINATIVLDHEFRIGAIDPRIYGGFIEHLGRCVYEGIFEPDHPKADARGFRADVMALTRELNMPVMRYPGGNFVSGYNWEDGVGPRAKRPRRLELAWMATESNRFGTNEFASWCRSVKTEPMLAVNLGTRGPDDARNLVEYCNHPGGTAWSDLRKKHGVKQPHRIKLWCLGNEVYGDWQMGHKTAVEYGRIAHEAAKLMKWVDPGIEVVLCGADQSWNAQALDLAYLSSDYLSIHAYYGIPEDDIPGALARSDEMADFIEATTATCDHVAARLNQKRPMMIAFDEWNVWDGAKGQWQQTTRWATAPAQLEQVYTCADALLVGSMLITLINHADRVKIANLAQLVNVIAPIMTVKKGPAWRQTIFYPFAQASNRGRGIALRQAIQSPRYDCSNRKAVPYLTSASVWDPESGAVTVFAVNRHLTEPLRLSVQLLGFERGAQLQSWQSLHHDNLQAANSASKQAVRPMAAAGAHIRDGVLSAELKPASWNVIRVQT